MSFSHEPSSVPPSSRLPLFGVCQATTPGNLAGSTFHWPFCGPLAHFSPLNQMVKALWMCHSVTAGMRSSQAKENPRPLGGARGWLLSGGLLLAQFLDDLLPRVAL